MKTLLFASLFFSANTYAQSITEANLKTLLTAKKATLEKVNVGMSKKTVTLSSIPVEGQDCNFTHTAVQSILRIDAGKMVVLSQESFAPAVTQACKDSGYTAYSESILFYEDAPTLTADLAELDAASPDIKSLSKAGEIITMSLNGKIQNEDGTTTTELVTLKYDLSKSSFRNLISTVAAGYSITTSDSADVNVNTVDLKDVLFCETSESDKNDCMRGDFSDILF